MWRMGAWSLFCFPFILKAVCFGILGAISFLFIVVDLRDKKGGLFTFCLEKPREIESSQFTRQEMGTDF
jgi:hypothetical protein